MITFLLLGLICTAGASVYLAVSVLAVPDFIPTREIKINWHVAALWPLVLAWLALTAMWKLTPFS